MIDLKSVSHKYKDRAVLNEMSYHFEVGKTYYISGKSGCGKSTLGMILSGLLEPSEGDVALKGQSAVMFQNPDLQFCMDTVYRELIFVLENKNVDIMVMDSLIDDVLKSVNATHLKHQKLVTLSGGEKQRIALASAFLMDTSILILDEPFASLDQSASQELLELLNTYRKHKQITLIVIDHLHHYYDSMIDVYLKIVDGNLCEGLDDDVEESVINISPQYCEKAVLNYENVSISYNDRAVVSHANFTINSGECVALVGDSGSGKSSLLHILLKLVKYDGNVWLDTANLKKYRGKMGYLFQNPRDQFLFASVYDEIYKTCFDESLTKKCLKSLNLWEHRDESPFNLSQGQQRRLALGIVFVTQAPIMVLDEPTFGQDRNSAIVIMNMIAQHCSKNHSTVIFTSHDPWIVDNYATRVIRIGEIQHES